MTTSFKHFAQFGLVWFFEDLRRFQPYLDLEAGDNQSLKIQVARTNILLSTDA